MRTSSVLATPGTPSSSTWPRQSRAITSPVTAASWPTTALATSARSGTQRLAGAASACGAAGLLGGSVTVGVPLSPGRRGRRPGATSAASSAGAAPYRSALDLGAGRAGRARRPRRPPLGGCGPRGSPSAGRSRPRRRRAAAPRPPVRAPRCGGRAGPGPRPSRPRARRPAAARGRPARAGGPATDASSSTATTSCTTRPPDAVGHQVVERASARWPARHRGVGQVPDQPVVARRAGRAPATALPSLVEAVVGQRLAEPSSVTLLPSARRTCDQGRVAVGGVARLDLAAGRHRRCVAVDRVGEPPASALPARWAARQRAARVRGSPAPDGRRASRPAANRLRIPARRDQHQVGPASRARPATCESTSRSGVDDQERVAGVRGVAAPPRSTSHQVDGDALVAQQLAPARGCRTGRRRAGRGSPRVPPPATGGEHQPRRARTSSSTATRAARRVPELRRSLGSRVDRRPPARSSCDVTVRPDRRSAGPDPVVEAAQRASCVASAGRPPYQMSSKIRAAARRSAAHSGSDRAGVGGGLVGGAARPRRRATARSSSPGRRRGAARAPPRPTACRGVRVGRGAVLRPRSGPGRRTARVSAGARARASARRPAAAPPRSRARTTTTTTRPT